MAFHNKYFFTFLSIFIVVQSYAKECELEPKTCILLGRLEVQSFPGPPNYTDIKKGDEDERGLYLRLDEPLSVHFEQEGKLKSQSVSIVHLTGSISDASFKRAHTKNHVSCKGVLFEQQTGHHHTPFLMDVDQVTEIKK